MRRTPSSRWLIFVATLLLAAFSFALFSRLASSPAAKATPTPTTTHAAATTRAPTAAASQTPKPSTSPTNTPSATNTLTPRDAIASIRACFAQPDLQPVHRRTFGDSRYPDVRYEQYEVDRFYIHLYLPTYQVESISRYALPRSSAPPTPDLTPRHTVAQLEAMARAFIARCAGNPNLDTMTPNHTRSPTETESVIYGFQWEDRTRVVRDAVPPSISVGYSRGGELLGYRNWLALSPLAQMVTPQATAVPRALLTPVCWSARAPIPTATATPVPYWQRNVRGLDPPVTFRCGAPLNRQGWVTHTSTGITQTNRAILDVYPNLKPPLITFMYPPTWRIMQLDARYSGAGNRAALAYVLSKHDTRLPETRGEGPAAGDMRIEFAMFLDAGSPDDYYDTGLLGHGAIGTVIEHGSFNGYRAMFASVGGFEYGFQRDVLFQAAPRVLIDIDISFYVFDANPDYVQQTLLELDGILESLRVIP